jgi:hypothetical protein
VGTQLWRHALLVGIGSVAVFAPVRPAAEHGASANDFAFLAPWFELDRKDRETLQRRGVVVRALPAHDRQIGVIAVTPISLSPETFVDRVRAAGGLKDDELVSGRFSNPPKLDDLAPVALDDGDVDRLRRFCRPNNCRLNLAAGEIATMHRALSTDGPTASAETQRAFRQVVLDRTVRYLRGGLEAVPAYDDRDDSVRPAAVFAEILRQTPYLKTHVPQVAASLERSPPADPAEAESFLRWSKTRINEKTVVMVSHVTIFRPAPAPGGPAVLVTGKQVYASRYMNGELTLTMLYAGEGGSTAHLVHINRSDLDELGGSFSGLKRSLMLGRIKDEATERLARVRDRLERPR